MESVVRNFFNSPRVHFMRNVLAHAGKSGRREVLGMEIGTSEAEPIWTEFLRKLARRGLRGVKLVVSDAHEGLKAAVTKVLSATWQRCRVGLLKKFLTTDSM